LPAAVHRQQQPRRIEQGIARGAGDQGRASKQPNVVQHVGHDGKHRSDSGGCGIAKRRQPSFHACLHLADVVGHQTWSGERPPAQAGGPNRPLPRLPLMPVRRPPLRDTSRRLAAALLWAALLGGVFAMHGLSTHGVMGSSASLAAVEGAAVMQGAMPGHDGHATPAGHPGQDGGHAGVAMLCLAILVATIVAAWIVGFLRRRPSFTVRRLEHRFGPRPATTHPPPRARFTVMRC
jgi:hypothetical protein